MSSIRKRTYKSGRTAYEVTFRDPYKRRTSRGGFATKKEAEAFERRVQMEMALGTYGKEEQTFEEFYRRWMQGKKPKLKTSTYASYEEAFRLYLLPAFRSTPLSQITPEDVQGLINDLSRRLSPGSVGKIYRCLRALFRAAEVRDHISKSPCRGIDLPRIPAKQPNFLRPEEITLLLGECKEPERTLFAVLAYSGLRLGEALALRWRDVGETSIRVNRSYGPYGFSDPKTETSRRTVPVMPLLSQILQEYRRECGGDPDPEKLLFSINGHSPIHKSTAYREFRDGLKAAGLRHVTIHSLRDSYASLMLSAGANVKVLQRALGHASATTTLNIYAHLMAEDMNAALERANDLAERRLSGAGKASDRDTAVNDGPIIR